MTPVVIPRYDTRHPYEHNYTTRDHSCNTWIPHQTSSWPSPYATTDVIPGYDTMRDHQRNTWIRHQTGVNDIIDVIKKWAGHNARLKDNILYRVDTMRLTLREWSRRQEDLKQDGEKTSSATWVLRDQE